MNLEAWEDYYDNTNGKTTFDEFIFDSRYLLTYNANFPNVYITLCSFSEISSTQAGGALCINGSNNEGQVLIESTLFSKCKSSGTNPGGAIYFNHYGSLKLSFVCGIRCNTGGTGDGNFCLLIAQSTESLSMNQSSIIHCIALINGGDWTIEFSYGNHKIESSNISRNMCGIGPAFLLANVNSGKVSYTSIVSNIAYGYNSVECSITAFREVSAEKSTYVQNSNYINNSLLLPIQGLISFKQHKLYFNNCSFIHNRENKIGKFVHSEAGSGFCDIENSYIDDMSKSIPGDCTINSLFSNEIIYTNIYLLNNNCNFHSNLNNLIHHKKSYRFHFIHFSKLTFLFSLNQYLFSFIIIDKV